MTPLRRVGALLGLGVLLLLVAGFGPDAARWPLLGIGLALVAGGMGVGIVTIVRALHPLAGIEARLSRVEGVLGDLAGTAGRQAPVVRRIDDRTRSLLAARSDAALAAQAHTDRRAVLVRDLDVGRRFRDELAPGERALLVIPREVDPALATRMVTELTSATVEVVPEEFLPGAGSAMVADRPGDDAHSDAARP